MKIDFPLNLEVCETSESAAHFLSKVPEIASGNFVLITGIAKSKIYAEDLLKSANLQPSESIQLRDNSIETVYALERKLCKTDLKFILAIGGGKVADFSKRLSYIANLPFALVPTIISNDGLISPIAVLADEGYSVSLPAKMPDIVLIDMSIILAAPTRYISAAAFDLISNITATNDWALAAKDDPSRFNHLSAQFARMGAYIVLDCKSWDTQSLIFTRSVVSGQMLSGIAMSLAGSSRPCSGSEHMISHALDAMKIGMNALHGEKVGLISRFCLAIQGDTIPEVEDFFCKHGIPKDFPGCNNATIGEMQAVFALARKIRPDRKSILDSFSDAELVEQYFEYIHTDSEKL